MKNKSRIKLWSLLLLSVAVLVPWGAGCDSVAVGNQGNGENGRAEVLALVGNDPITTTDLEAVLHNIPERKRKVLREKVLDNLIEARVFAQEARKAGLDADAGVREACEKEANEILARQFVKNHLDVQSEPSEETLQTFYRDHRDQFLVPESVLIQQISIKDEQDALEIKGLLDGGASFEELIERDDRAQGGEPVWHYKGKMDPALEKAAFHLQADALSDVIRTKGNHQIIKVLDKRKERRIPYEEAKPRIRHRLYWKNRQDLIKEFYERARVDSNPTEPGVLAKVGDEVITEESLESVLANVPKEKKEDVRLRWAEYFIETKVFSAEARKAGLQNDPEVARQIERKTDRVLANAFRQQVLTGRFEVTEDEIARYYESHPELFTVPVKVRAKSILVKTEEEAAAALQELRGGASFGHLAQKRSLHPHAARRAGEIGWFSKGEQDPAIERAAFSLEKGQMSGVIETASGYEIIKVMDKKGGGIQPLDEVRPIIKMTLTMEEEEREKKLYYEKAGVKLMDS